MSEYDVDFTGVNNTHYLEPGTYRAWLFEVDEREGRQAPLFVWTFVDATGAKSNIATSLSEAALWKLQEVLTALGVDASGKMRLSVAKLRKLVNRPAMIEVIAEPGADGKTYSKISKAWREDQREEEPPPPEDEYAADFDDSPF